MDEDELHRRITKIEETFKNVRFVGDGRVNVQGSFQHGFSIDLTVAGASGGGVVTPPTICEGDFEGDYTGPDENTVDVNTLLPYDITVIWIELTGTPTDGNTQVGYGAEGEGVTFINFAEGFGSLIGVTADTFRWTADPAQPVPLGGFLQIGTGDWTDTGLGDGTFHYKIHYTYNCADAP